MANARKYEKATNMRGNKPKFVGIQCGTLKDQPIPPNIPPQIKWLKQKEHTNILGVPFGSTTKKKSGGMKNTYK
jgi:hypothetical protein